MANLVAKVPRSVLFGSPAYASPAISPDGKWLRYLAPVDGVMNVWVAPTSDRTAARVVTHDRRRGIRSAGFCYDDQSLFYLNDNDGDENWRLYLVDLETGESRCVTPFDNIQAKVIAHNRWHPTTMLLGLNKADRARHDVYRLDLRTDELTEVATNPGYLNWLVDTNLQLRGGTKMNPGGGATVYLGDSVDGAHDPWLEVPAEDVTGTRVVGFSRDDSSLYLTSSIEANASRLFEVDLNTGEQLLLAEDPVYDIKRVVMHPERRTPEAVVFAKDRDEWMFLDEGFKQTMTQINERLRERGVDGEVSINRSDRSGQKWSVSVDQSSGPATFYIFDHASGGLEYLFDHQPLLGDYELATMESFSFKARDGVTVHGYLTVPPGVEPRDLPAVMNVHGGPWTRDSWGYNPEAQWLATQGYACIQVNFRGSLGYGKHFQHLGAKQWAAAMHTDLLDAMDHLASQHIVDADRVAIMGASYGGYAALVGAAFTPDRFRCAIDVCGPSNLLTLLTTMEPYLKPLRSFMYANVGDPETERDMLWERSPLSRADQITIPIMIVHGANDVRVKQEEAEQIVSALKARGVPHTYLLFDDEGHGLAREENGEKFYSAAETFLATYLA